MNLKKIKIFIKSTLIVMILLFTINFLSGYFSERVDIYVKQKAILEASNMISKTIQSEVLPSINMDNLIRLNTNESSQVESISINTYQINRIMADTTQKLQESLLKINNQQIDNLTLPFGIVISDTLFSNVGPDITIRIHPIGSVKCDVETKSEHYGINNTLLTIDIVAKIQITTIIPLRKSTVDVITKIPIVVQIIQGQVPRYYFSGGPSEGDHIVPGPWDVD